MAIAWGAHAIERRGHVGCHGHQKQRKRAIGHLRRVPSDGDVRGRRGAGRAEVVQGHRRQSVRAQSKRECSGGEIVRRRRKAVQRDRAIKQRYVCYRAARIAHRSADADAVGVAEHRVVGRIGDRHAGRRVPRAHRHTHHGRGCGETAIVGDNVLLYQGVTLGGTGKETGKRHPTLGNNVVVGAGAKILGNIIIGDNSYIGANAVVIKDVPSNSTVVGIPGRITKQEGSKIDMSLDHMHVSDPVMDNISRLLGRIKALEKKTGIEASKDESDIDFTI